MKKGAIIALIMIATNNTLSVFALQSSELLHAIEKHDLSQVQKLLRRGRLTKKEKRALLRNVDPFIDHEHQRRPSAVPAVSQILLGTVLTAAAFHYFCHCPNQKSFLENIIAFCKGEFRHGHSALARPSPFLTTLIKCAGMLYGMGPLLIYNGYSTLTSSNESFYDLLALRTRISQVP